MNWLFLIILAIGILAALTIIGLVKNIIRTAIALAVGFAVAAGLYYGANLLGITGISNALYLAIGGIAAVITLARMSK